MRSPTGSEPGVGSGAWVDGVAFTAAWTGTCVCSGVDACGLAGDCCAEATGAGADDVKAGAVLAGSREAGLCAVWQAEKDKARTASIAIRIWSFATRIFFYEIRIALRCKRPVNSIKNRTSRSSAGQRRKGTGVITLGSRPDGYRRTSYSDGGGRAKV